MAASDKVKPLTDEIMEHTHNILQKKKAELHKGTSMIPVEDDMDWYTEEIREQAEKIAEGYRKIAYNVAENVMLPRDEGYNELIV
ncbi:hypothetical protein Tco_0893839 [Tanacetum coccineum]|uniref:Uncharacterized protein n=1 Tax=Tanacetum coccineum TaxID=301880 RepID=A0ABQ5CBI9_9ASTR